MIHIRITRNELGKITPESINEIHLSITKESISSFRTLLSRALNTWDTKESEKYHELSNQIEEIFSEKGN